jgi:hypothetical protein
VRHAAETEAKRNDRHQRSENPHSVYLAGFLKIAESIFGSHSTFVSVRSRI